MTKRFILDTSTGLCHDLNYIHENCQINKLDSKHIFDAESLEEEIKRHPYYKAKCEHCMSYAYDQKYNK